MAFGFSKLSQLMSWIVAGSIGVKRCFLYTHSYTNHICVCVCIDGYIYRHICLHGHTVCVCVYMQTDIVQRILNYRYATVRAFLSTCSHHLGDFIPLSGKCI